MTGSTTRRERQRERTRAEILRLAGDQVARHGAATLSLRSLARDLGTGVSSLYRYFEGRDDLLTALLVEAFDAQADAVEAATAGQTAPRAALACALHAYRGWSVAHPGEFSLAYGTPVPGYAALGGETVRAGARVGDFLLAELGRAWHEGEVSAARVDARTAVLGAAERADLEALASRRGYDLPLGLLSLAVDLLVRIHGFVSMEVLGQLRPLSSSPAEVFGRLVDVALADVGLADVSVHRTDVSDAETRGPRT